MNRSPARVARLAWAAMLLFLALAGMEGGTPGDVVAQTVPELQQRQSDYDAARSALEAAIDGQQAQEIRWQDALAEVDRARRAGDPSRLEAADRRAWAESAEVTRLRQQVQEAEALLSQRRDALEQALERQMDLVASQLSTAGPQEAQSLRSRFNAYESQHSRLRAEAAAETPSSARLSYLSDIVPALDPRMPLQVRVAQIDLLDRRVQDLEEEIARVDEEMAGVQRLLQIQRRADESTSTLGRFGATDPVGATRPRTQPGAATSAELPTEPITLEQELELWQVYKTELELLRHNLEFRVAEFRRSIPGAGGR